MIIACAWAHAFRIHNIQLESGVQAEEVEGRFSQLLAAAPILLDQRRIDILDDVTHANHVNWPVFLTRGLGEVIMSMSTDVGRALAPDPEALLRAFGTQSEWPATLMDLIGETEARANALISFLGGPWIAPVNAVFPQQIINERLGGSPRTLALEQLERVENDLTDYRAWTCLKVIVGDAPFYAEEAQRIHHLLQRVELHRLLETKGEEGLSGIQFVCAQARHLCSDETRQRFERELLACAAFCQAAREERKGLGSDNDAFERIAWRLLGSVFLLTARGTGPEEASPFWKLTAKLVHICPALGTILRRRLGGRVPPLPFALARGAWPFFLTLRAAP